MFIKHPWHGIDPEFDHETILSVVEISRGKRAKYEIDKASGLLRLDRVLFTSFVYPINYGIFPRTLGEDGDPLDLLLLTQVDVEPLCLAKVRPVGLLRMNDRGEGDDKIICILPSDPSVVHISDIDQVPFSLKEEIKHFFQQYTSLEGKAVKVDNFYDKIEALKTIEASLVRYQTKFGNSF